MAVTEEELEKKQAKNAKLREQIEAQLQKASAVAQEKSLELQGTQLDAETARLEAQLAAAKEAAKVSTIKAGTEGLAAQAQAELDAAQAGFTVPGVPVNTNPEDSSDNKDGE
jgi:hypothetical protein